jgi:hypothetical protein
MLSNDLVVRRLKESLGAPQSKTQSEPSRLQSHGGGVQLTVQAN